MTASNGWPVTDFITGLDWEALPDTARRQARRCLLDTLGVAVGGRLTDLSSIIHTFAAEAYAGSGARLWLDGRAVSPPGAALANGMTIDALDIHDGFTLTKGHAGAAIVPATLATLSLGGAAGPVSGPVSGRELLVSLVVGYEIGLRAGLALHARACDYHTSGAWNALGCAAVTARRLSLGPEQIRHALGIAEYHGPRSQMMRCIDYPTMVKDGSGWGAMAGVSAGQMAGHGFTGAPALTVEAPEMAHFWHDLGRRWRITEQYFKPHAVCRWAQPAVTGALALREDHHLAPEEIRSIRVFTFHEAVRLKTARPATTEEAQYSLPFPLAAALVHGRLGGQELSGPALEDALTQRLADGVSLIEVPAYNERFPAERLARVEIETADGRVWDSGEVEATWGAEDPPDDRALLEKFRRLAEPLLPPERLAALEEAAWFCDRLDDAERLVDLLAAPAER